MTLCTAGHLSLTIRRMDEMPTSVGWPVAKIDAELICLKPMAPRTPSAEAADEVSHRSDFCRLASFKPQRGPHQNAQARS